MSGIRRNHENTPWVQGPTSPGSEQERGKSCDRRTRTARDRRAIPQLAQKQKNLAVMFVLRRGRRSFIKEKL
jgi:hypothetical protein